MKTSSLLRLALCPLWAALCALCGPNLKAQRLIDNVQMGGASNQVKSGATLTVMSGGNFTIASGGTLTFTAGTVVGTLAIANGGTGSANASDARTALGLAIGTNVQAFDADLTTYAGITPAANVQTFLGAADYSAMRTQLGLVIGTNVQAFDADLTTYAGITPAANVQTFLGAADYAAMRTQLGLVIGTNVQAFDADLTTYAGITPSANIQSFLGAADYSAARTLLFPSSAVEGDLAYFNGTSWARLARGTDGQVLKATAATVAWGTDSEGSGSLPGSPTAGDTVYYDGAAWAKLAIGTAGQLLHVNSGATAPEWAAKKASGSRVRLSGNQSINNNTDTALSWATEDWDAGGYWAGGAPTRFTVPATGIYTVNLNVRFAINASGVRFLSIKLNNTTTEAYRYVTPVNGSETVVPLTADLSLTATDYLEAIVFQNSGSALNVEANATCHFSITFRGTL